MKFTSVRNLVVGLVLMSLVNCSNSQNEIETGDAKRFVRQGASLMADGVHKYDVSQSTFYLGTLSDVGFSMTQSIQYGSAQAMVPLRGDWNGDGTETIGLYQPRTGMFFLKNSDAPGIADLSFQFGPGSSTGAYMPVVGDWNGDRTDTIGIVHLPTHTYFLRNSNTAGVADLTYVYGSFASMQPLVGDWDGDGKDTPGVYWPDNGFFYLRNSHMDGRDDLVFQIAAPSAGLQAVAGDWNADGVDTVGLYNPQTGLFSLKNSNYPGKGDASYALNLAANQKMVVGKLPPCSGTKVGGYCWHMAPDRQSCAAVCSSRGGYNQATRTFAGSDGTFSNCLEVFNAIKAEGKCTAAFCSQTVKPLSVRNTNANFQNPNAHGTGCSFGDVMGGGDAGLRVLHTSYPATTDTAYIVSGSYRPPSHRICACNN